MENSQEAIVLAVDGAVAKIKVARHLSCENCGACPGSAAMVIDALNHVNARPGQKVLVSMKEVNMVKAAFIVYILPLLALFAGMAVGGYIAAFFIVDPIWGQVIGAVSAFLFSVYYVRHIDRQAGRDAAQKPVIIKILSGD